MTELQQYVDSHINLAVNSFKSLWDSNELDEILLLFIAYIVDERIYCFGDRWMTDCQIGSISAWESKNTLYSILSKNYGSCLQFFIHNNFVYESDWTSYGNAREYTLCDSLQEFLFNCPQEYIDKLQNVKNTYHDDLPF